LAEAMVREARLRRERAGSRWQRLRQYLPGRTGTRVSAERAPGTKRE
jgi:hypothetical protein